MLGRLNAEQIGALADGFLRVMPVTELAQFAAPVSEWERYQRDPALFCSDELGLILTDDMLDLVNSVRDNPVTIAISGNAVGKTVAAAAVAIWFYRVFAESEVYTASAPPAERNLKKKLWAEIRQLLGNNPRILSAEETVHALDIVDHEAGSGAKHFITGVTIPMSGTEEQRESKFSGSHAEHILFVLDEGDAIPDEVYRGIDGCMSGGHARLLVMFNPKSRSGAAYRMIRDGRAHVVRLDVMKHPNVTTGRNRIPGAVTRQQTVRRINEWTEPLPQGAFPGADAFEVPEFLVGSVAKSTKGVPYPPLPAGQRVVVESQFYYMVLGEYPVTTEDRLIRPEWVSAARSRWDLLNAANGGQPPQGATPIVALDVADLGGDYNVLTARYGGWVPRQARWRGQDVAATSVRAAEVSHALKANVFAADGTGVGAGVAAMVSRTFRVYCDACSTDFGQMVQQLPDECPACKVKGRLEPLYISSTKVMVASTPTFKTEQGEFGCLRDQLWWAVREWLRADPGATLPPDEGLVEELLLPYYAVRHGKLKIMDKEEMRSALGRSPDNADSLCLTFAPAPAAPRVRMINFGYRK